MRALLIATLLSVVPACGASAFDATEQARLVLPSVTVIDLDPTLVLPIVLVDLDGHEGLPFLMDSGSSVTSLEPGLVAELGLEVSPYSSASHSTGSDGREVTFDGFVPVESMQIGGLRLEHLRLPVVGNDPARQFGWAGILGQDVLARLPVVLDSQRDQVHLLPPGSGIEEIKEYLRDAQVGDGQWAVLEIDFRPCPYLPLSVDGEADGLHELLIDTGASKTCLSQPVIDALGLEPTGSYKARSIAGIYEGLTYRLEGLGLLGLKVSADVQDTPLEHGMLGMDVLGKLVVVLEGEAGRLWLHLRGEADDGLGADAVPGDAADDGLDAAPPETRR